MNYFIVKEKEGMIWLDVPEPKIPTGFPLSIDEAKEINKKTNDYNTRPHYPYDNKLFDWKDEQRVQFNVDFYLDLDEPVPCYQPTTVIALPIRLKEQEEKTDIELAAKEYAHQHFTEGDYERLKDAFIAGHNYKP